MGHYKAAVRTCRICLQALLLTVITLPVHATETTELMILNWPDYMDPLVLVEFEQRTGIAIKQTYFESDAARDATLVQTDARGFDIALIDGTSIRLLAKRGWLEPITEAEIPNLKHINPRWRSAHEEAKAYAVPYFWGTVGIAYRKDLVATPVSSWMDLLKPSKELQGKVAMFSDTRELIGIGLKALGYSLNSINIKELKEAEALLQAQSPAVKTYQYISRDEYSALVTGQVAISMMYNSYASMVQQHHDQIAFVVPKEGSNVWVDYFSILSASPNKAAAKQFLNFINEPKVAAQLAEFAYSATPNLAAEAYLPTEFKNNLTVYPNEETLKNLETNQRLPAKYEKLRATISSRLVN